MIGIMVNKSTKIIIGLRESKQAKKTPKIEIVGPWEL